MSYQIIRNLPSEEEVKTRYPMTLEMTRNRARKLVELKEILSGSSSKLILIIGPCSADNEDVLVEYCKRLLPLQEAYQDKIFMIPRVYSSKPRSNGTGYKGILHEPVLGEPENIEAGIFALRKLHHMVLQETGFITADEMLYPENYFYIDDLLGYFALGARSSEDQYHRFAASASDIPCGVKNPTGGSMESLLDSVSAVQTSQQFGYKGYEVCTDGNPFAHCILRGYTTENDMVHQNYTKPYLKNLIEKYKERSFQNPGFLIDTNHSNSGKNWSRQPEIIHYIMNLYETEPSLMKFFKGFMVESYLEDGCQPLTDHRKGCSYTDPCIGFSKTELVIHDIYQSLKKGAC